MGSHWDFVNFIYPEMTDFGVHLEVWVSYLGDIYQCICGVGAHYDPMLVFVWTCMLQCPCMENYNLSLLVWCVLSDVSVKFVVSLKPVYVLRDHVSIRWSAREGDIRWVSMRISDSNDYCVIFLVLNKGRFRKRVDVIISQFVGTYLGRLSGSCFYS